MADNLTQQLSELAAHVADLSRPHLTAMANKLHGGADRHLTFMERLVQRFGYESPELKDYIERQAAVTKQLHEAGLMEQPLTANEARLEQLTHDRMAANPKMTRAQAFTAALLDNPDVYGGE